VVVLAGAGGLALRRLPRPEALGLAAMGVGALLMALDFHLRTHGEYFLFKVLAFLGPVLVAAGVVGLGTLLGRRARVRAAAAAALVALAGAFVVNVRREVEGVAAQASSSTFELRGWAKRLPPGKSILLATPPNGVQLWSAYMLHSHPLSAYEPLTGTSYPHVPAGRKADYVLAVTGQPRPPRAAGGPVLRNGEFTLYRMDPAAPGRDRSSRTRIQP
jgi:hypothetical protein